MWSEKVKRKKIYKKIESEFSKLIKVIFMFFFLCDYFLKVSKTLNKAWNIQIEWKLWWIVWFLVGGFVFTLLELHPSICTGKLIYTSDELVFDNNNIINITIFIENLNYITISKSLNNTIVLIKFHNKALKNLEGKWSASEKYKPPITPKSMTKKL